MSKISTALDLIRNNRGVFAATIIERFGFLFPDVLYTKILFRLRMGYKLNLKNPRTFNEKLQWLKLYDHNPLYTILVDKCAVKDYVANIIGEEHIIPTLGVWNKPEDIDFDSLPDQFVLKTTHGGGNLGVYICKDKSKIDIPAVIKKMKKAMKQNLYKESREWPYKNVPKRIIAEKYISNDAGQGIDDYKFHCFNGIPEVILVCRERFQNTLKKDFFNMDWEHLDVSRLGSSVSNDVIGRPENFDKMVALSKALSSKIPFVRCDFYSVGNELFFGEMTFFPSSGLNPFSPEEFDKELGDYLVLPMGGGKTLICSDNVYLLVKECGEFGLRDYKFFCFDGEVKSLFIATDRDTGNVKFDYFDSDYNHLDLVQSHPMSGKQIEKPKEFEEMIEIASKLSKGLPQVRVDLYTCNSSVYFGELTFCHHGGITPFHPIDWDYKWGEWINLPNK